MARRPDVPPFRNEPALRGGVRDPRREPKVESGRGVATFHGVAWP
jgi:hypothetical protein